MIIIKTAAITIAKDIATKALAALKAALSKVGRIKPSTSL